MPIPDTARDLHRRLQEYTFDEGVPALPFHVRLARENRWSPGFTARAIAEYRRFVLLAMIAGHPVTPSDEVDQVWHLHLLYTRAYWDRLCGDVLRQPLHHDPTSGGAQEGGKYFDWYARTLASYARIFDEPPPRDIWPDGKARFAHPEAFARIDLSRHLLLPRISLRSRS